MPRKQCTDEEQERPADYPDLFDVKHELHKLLKRVAVSTKLGRQDKRPDDDVELDIGNGSIGSCGKYGQVRYYPSGFFGEYELDNDGEIIYYLLKEINKRFQKFRKARDSNKLEYIRGKKKFARKFFDMPLAKLEEKEGDNNETQNAIQ